MSDNLAALTATQLSDLYDSGEASPVDVTRAVLNQIEAHNPTLNCFCLVNADSALASAGEAEARWPFRGQVCAVASPRAAGRRPQGGRPEPRRQAEFKKFKKMG